MKGSPLRISIVAILMAIAVVKIAGAAIAASSTTVGFNAIGTDVGWERNDIGGFSATAKYLPGFAYHDPAGYYTSTVSNLMYFSLGSPDSLNNIPLKNYTVYLWYSYRLNSHTTPLYNLLQLYGTLPESGPVDTGRVYSASISRTVSSEISFGTEELGLKAGQSVTVEAGVSDPARVLVSVYQSVDQPSVTASDINNLQSMMLTSRKISDVLSIDTKGSNAITLAPDSNWKFRYLGKITVTPYTDRVPRFMDLGALIASGDDEANYVDNTLHDGVYVVAVVVANYYKAETSWDHGWRWPPIYRHTTLNEPKNMITFIFGDNSQRIGDDGYLWFYKVIN
ncbi:hypothetical protein [Thermococcus sp. Bubb.Bath]|uniref:hypothetical protein n=1 Tax=Thermococcus sp. Bubb.Bath TaxID=1638242 RepID=UPI00143AF011|nr:hypothetical protein [Thermococcus sp. Bubb.Bath]NJF24822.1 hypothetical protein [Thermococcus sp. Bubb.Bath]